MALWALTHERVEQIESQLKQKQQQVADLEKATIQELWLKDLEAIKESYPEGYKNRAKHTGAPVNNGPSNNGLPSKPAPTVAESSQSTAQKLGPANANKNGKRQVVDDSSS